MNSITYVKGIPTAEQELNKLGFSEVEMFLTSYSNVLKTGLALFFGRTERGDRPQTSFNYSISWTNEVHHTGLSTCLVLSQSNQPVIV